MLGDTSGPSSHCPVQDPSSAHWPPLDASGPLWLYIYLPDFLAGLERRSYFSASEITWELCCSPPTWCLYDIKLKVCAICPNVQGCLGCIACWHSVKTCAGCRKSILIQSCPYCRLGWIFKVNYLLNYTDDFSWGWLTGAPQNKTIKETNNFLHEQSRVKYLSLFLFSQSLDIPKSIQTSKGEA